jgi:hypothetical protein
MKYLALILKEKVILYCFGIALIHPFYRDADLYEKIQNLNPIDLHLIDDFITPFGERSYFTFKMIQPSFH